MLNSFRFGVGAALIVLTIGLAPNAPVPTFAAEGTVKNSAVKVTMSAQAKKFLKKHGWTIEGGCVPPRDRSPKRNG